MRQKVLHFKGGAGPYALFIKNVSKNQLLDPCPFTNIDHIKVLS